MEFDSDVEKESESVEKSILSDFSIRVNKIRKIYSNGIVAVKNVSFGIPNGECFCLLGSNGAGKTTTFKMLCGEIVPTEGEMHIKGLNVS